MVPKSQEVDRAAAISAAWLSVRAQKRNPSRRNVQAALKRLYGFAFRNEDVDEKLRELNEAENAT